MKIKSLQGGGLLTFTPFIGSPTTGISGNHSPKESSKSDSGPKNSTGILDDEIYKELVNKGGLMNDVDNLVQRLHSLQSATVNPFMDSGNSSSALKMISEINRLRQSSETWKEAGRSARSQNSLGEIAIGHSGEVFIKNKDNRIQAISVSEYKKKRDSVRLLTNAELLHERNQNPFLVGNDNISSIVGSSVGLNKITEHIKGIISAFGTTSFSDEKTYTKTQTNKIRKQLGQSVGKTPSKEQMESLQVLNSIIDSPGDYAKVKLEKSTERGQAMKAARYIWSTLGSASQNKLQVTAIANGMDSPVELILDMISNQTDESINTTITPIDEKTAKGGSSSGSGDETPQIKNMTQFQMFFKQSLNGVWTDFMMNDPKIGSLFKGAVGSKGPLVDKNDDPIGTIKLSEVLINHQYNSLVDTSKIYLGDNKVSTEDLNNIIYNSAEDSGIIFVPTKNDGSPDYESLERFNEANQVFEANKSNWTESQIRNHFKRYHFDVNVQNSEQDGVSVKILAESNNVKPFLVMSAYTNDAAENIVENKNRLSKLSFQELDQMKPYFESIWTIGSGKSSKNLTPRNPWYKFGTPYYKGAVLIQVKPEAGVVADAFVGQGPRHAVSSLDNVKYNIRNSNQHSSGGLNPMTSSAVI